MKHYHLRDWRSGTYDQATAMFSAKIFDGEFDSLYECLKAAREAGKSLHGVDLRWANLAGADLAGWDLTGSIINHADFRRANLKGTILARSTGSGMLFFEAQMQNADLRGANWNTIHQWDTAASGAIITGAFIGNARPSIEPDNLSTIK